MLIFFNIFDLVYLLFFLIFIFRIYTFEKNRRFCHLREGGNDNVFSVILAKVGIQVYINKI